MTSLANSIAKASPSTDDLSQQIQTLQANFMKLARTVSDEMSEGVGNAGRQISQTGRDAQATATNAVLGHPLTAVGVAVGIGLLLGMITRKA